MGIASGDVWDSKTNRVKLILGKSKEERRYRKTTKKTVQSSNTKAGGTVSYIADGDIILLSQNISASAIALDSKKGNLLVGAMKSSNEEINERDLKEGELSLQVGNAYLDLAVAFAYGASNWLLGGRYRELLEIALTTERAVAAATVGGRLEQVSQMRLAVSATANFAENVGSAAANTATAGFYATVTASYDTISTTSYDFAEFAVGSNLIADNISMKAAEGEVTIEGSKVLGGESLSIDAKKGINIVAAKEKRIHRSSENTFSASADLFSTEIDTFRNIRVSGSNYSESGAESSYSGSLVSAQNVSLKSDGDLALRGSLVVGRFDNDIKGKTIVESLKDTYTQQGTGSSYEVSASSSNGGSGGAGVGRRGNNVDSAEVNSVAGLIGLKGSVHRSGGGLESIGGIVHNVDLGDTKVAEKDIKGWTKVSSNSSFIGAHGSKSGGKGGKPSGGGSFQFTRGEGIDKETLTRSQINNEDLAIDANSFILDFSASEESAAHNTKILSLRVGSASVDEGGNSEKFLITEISEGITEVTKDETIAGYDTGRIRLDSREIEETVNAFKRLGKKSKEQEIKLNR